VLRIEPSAQLTLLDQSPGMLGEAADVAGEHVLGLPFPDGAFDVVVSGWVIETVTDPMAAVREYLRVINPAGHVLYSFCSMPHGFFSRAGTAWLRAVVGRGFAGDFLPESRTPWHDCERSHRMEGASGLVTEVALGKCCRVGAPLLPAGLASGDSGA
jgi:ubiquinone/menaquinone biosynthesis C-methylase UbiE